MDAKYLSNIKAANTQIAKQERQLERINTISKAQAVQYLQQAQNIQIILHEQELVNYQTQKAQAAMQKTTGALGGLKAVAGSLGKVITDAFTTANIGGYLIEAVNNADSLEKQFLVLRLSLGKLKSAIGEAAAPIVSAFLPMIQNAVYAAIRWVKNLGLVIRALFGGAQASEEMAQAQEELAKSSGKASRTLASFDKLERLNGGSGGSGSTSGVKLEPVNDKLTPQLQSVVETIKAVMAKLQSLFAPLKAIDFTPAADAFHRLGEAVSRFGLTALTGLERLWHTLLVPLARWTVQEAVPASVNVLTAAFSALSAAFHPLQAGLSQLGAALTPFARFLKETVLLAIRGVESQFHKLAQVFTEKAPALTGIFTNLGQAFSALWELAQPAFENLRSRWNTLMDSLGTAASGGIAYLIDSFFYLTEFLSGLATGSWAKAWEGMKNILLGAVNGIIGLLNSLLAGLTGGINGVIRSLNSLSVKVPDWVPGLGGKTFGFHIAPITAPRIPYLAQGAVLPANKPFLAMVGDQRHGTNVEAPLTTIQEAVALVMQDQTDAIMAGFNASVEVQREILSAVLGIQIGDEVIAGAYDRYRSRQTVMKGAYHAL